MAAWITKKKKEKTHKVKYGESSKYYNNKLWKRLRNNYIKHHPLCERCLERDKITPAEHVHHIIPFLTGEDEYERIKLLSDYDNLMSLCARCHRIIHGYGIDE